MESASRYSEADEVTIFLKTINETLSREEIKRAFQTKDSDGFTVLMVMAGDAHDNVFDLSWKFIENIFLEEGLKQILIEGNSSCSLYGEETFKYATKTFRKNLSDEEIKTVLSAEPSKKPISHFFLMPQKNPEQNKIHDFLKSRFNCYDVSSIE